MSELFKQADEFSFDWNMLGDVNVGRENLGDKMPVVVYRLFEYTMKDALAARYGKETAKQIFRESGYLAGKAFCENVLDVTKDLGDFTSDLQEKMKDFQIGVLRFEKFDAETGAAVLTVAEDLDCSGLPTTGEAVCNYDEGFIKGILDTYTKSDYTVVEVDCWAKGDRVCRFNATTK